MDASKQKERLKAIAESEYRKICEQYPIISGEESEYDITAFSILNTPKLGISYWHGPDGSGFSVCELVYNVHSLSDRKNTVCFQSMEEAEAFLKKTKAKHFKNPYDCCITKEYVHAIYFDCISDEIFNSLEKDIQLKKTVINKKEVVLYLQRPVSELHYHIQ